jgi:bifunctional non-homologous end joining protein LigD
MCAVGKDGLTDFSALQAAMKSRRTDELIFFAFDLLWLGVEDLRARHLMERKESLRRLLLENPDRSVIRFHGHLGATGGDVIDIACT